MSTIQPALSTVSLHHLPWPQVLDAARDSGFTAIELLMIPGWVHVAPQRVSAAEIRQEFRTRGLRLIGVHGGGLDGSSEEMLSGTLAYLGRLLPVAAAAGAAFLNINGMHVPAGTTPVQRRQMLERIIHGLRVLEPQVRALGMQVTLENHAHCHIATPEDYQVILDAFPLPEHAWLGATVDTGHFHLSQVDLIPAIHSLRGRVLHVHVKDHRGEHSVPLGTGTIDNLGAVRALRAAGYHGHLSCELELGDATQSVAAVRQAMPYLQQLISSTSLPASTANAATSPTAATITSTTPTRTRDAALSQESV